MTLLLPLSGLFLLLSSGGSRAESLPEDAMSLGREHHDAGNYKAALAAYGRLLRAQKEHAGALYESALSSWAAGDISQATIFSHRAVSAAPARSSAYYSLLGSLLDLSGQWRAGELAFREGLDRWPSEPSLTYNLGVNLVQQERFDDAESAFSQSLQSRPNHAPTYRQIASLMGRRQSVAAELLARTRALGMDPLAPTAERDAHRSWALLFHALAVGQALDAGLSQGRVAPESPAGREQALMRLLGLRWPSPHSSDATDAFRFARELDTLLTLMSDQQLMMGEVQLWKRLSLAHFDKQRRDGGNLAPSLAICALAGQAVPARPAPPSEPTPTGTMNADDSPRHSTVIRIAREPQHGHDHGDDHETTGVTQRASHGHSHGQ